MSASFATSDLTFNKHTVIWVSWSERNCSGGAGRNSLVFSLVIRIKIQNV